MSAEGDGATEDAIKVVVRLRPPLQRETGLITVWSAGSNQTIQRNDGKEQYTFDVVFDGMSRTEDVYTDCVEEVVKSAMAGYNGTVFAYGQTASGKTYTIFGDKYNDGVVQMAVDTIFSTIESGDSKRYLLRMSCVEIYNERVRDLLSDRTDLSIMEVKGNVVIGGIVEEVITERNGVDTLIQAAFERRAVGETSSNERSSRSHAILRFVIESHDDDSQMGTASYIAYLNIVDLAGSENAEQSGTEELRLREGSNVNRSLFALSRVISQLTTKNSHVSFRDSKLTRLLKTSLGGNSKTLIICTASPVALHETSQALKFASRAKFVKNKPMKNKMTDDALLSKYLRTIEELRKQLEENQKAEHHERDLEVQNEQLSAEVRRLRSCILSGQQQQQPPLTIDERKRQRARRQTWGGVRAYRMSLSPTFGDFGSSLALLRSKNIIGSPIEEEPTPSASGRSSMESVENERITIVGTPEKNSCKPSYHLKRLKEVNEKSPYPSNSNSSETFETMGPLHNNGEFSVAACDHASAELINQTTIESQGRDSDPGAPLEDITAPDRSHTNLSNRTIPQNQGAEFGTTIYTPSENGAKHLRSEIDHSTEAIAEQTLSQNTAAMNTSTQSLVRTAVSPCDEKMATAVEWTSNDGSASARDVASCVTVGQHSLVAPEIPLGEINNDFGRSTNTEYEVLDSSRIVKREDGGNEIEDTPGKKALFYGGVGESPSEEEDTPAQSQFSENVKNSGGDVAMKDEQTNGSAGLVERYADVGLLETSVIAFSTCQISIEGLRGELEEERLARKRERLELIETIAELKKRLSFYETRMCDLSKGAFSQTVDPLLEEERAANNHLRNILFEGKQKYEELKAKSRSLEERVKWLEAENELWGRRCDEADEMEGQLREEIADLGCQKIRLLAERESLKKELEDTKKQMQLQEANGIAEGMELQSLRDERRELEQLVKKLRKEVLKRDNKISALQCELRRVSSIHNTENVILSPGREEERTTSVTLHNSNTSTPVRNVCSPSAMPPSAPSKKKFVTDVRMSQEHFEDSVSGSEAPPECNQQ